MFSRAVEKSQTREQRMTSVIEMMICSDVQKSMSGTEMKEKNWPEHFEMTHILTRSAPSQNSPAPYTTPTWEKGIDPRWPAMGATTARKDGLTPDK